MLAPTHAILFTWEKEGTEETASRHTDTRAQSTVLPGREEPSENGDTDAFISGKVYSTSTMLMAKVGEGPLREHERTIKHAYFGINKRLSSFESEKVTESALGIVRKVPVLREWELSL